MNHRNEKRLNQIKQLLSEIETATAGEIVADQKAAIATLWTIKTQLLTVKGCFDFLHTEPKKDNDQAA
jgi:hypothetical protein